METETTTQPTTPATTQPADNADDGALIVYSLPTEADDADDAAMWEAIAADHDANAGQHADHRWW